MRNFLFFLACLSLVSGMAWSGQERVFQFSYAVDAGTLPNDEAIDLYIPLPGNLPGQQIERESLQSTLPGTQGTEGRYGNRYYHIHREAGSTVPIKVSFDWTVTREHLGTNSQGDLSEEELKQFLAPNALVPVGHEVLQPILAEIHEMRKDASPEATARAIYDWVVDNVEYKKVGTGWGNGDTFWACNERYGNCTDFHALFVSLARSEGIPARFEIGFPVPLDRESGDIGGYHCWVQFYLPEKGWVPIDASEAAKHPEQREQLFGSHPADRIHFTTGRDLVLSTKSPQSPQPLNYFIYPYVEVGGRPYTEKLTTKFSFKEVSVSQKVASQ